MLEFEIPIEPIAKGRPRFSKFGTYTPEKTVKFEKSVANYIREHYLNALLGRPLRVKIEFHVKRPTRPKKSHLARFPAKRPDLDNFCKGIFDSLNNIIWQDDALICEVHAKKVYAINEPKILIQVEELE